MNFETAILEPSGKMVVCVTANPGVWVRAWVADLANSFKAKFTFTPSTVTWNKTTTLTLRADAAAVNATASSWFSDGTYLYVRPPTGQNVYAGTIQAIVPQYFSNHPKNYSGTQYDPRIKSVPSISQRIEARFGGVAQIGGGSITFINTDGYFNGKMDWQWDAGLVSIKLGLDIDGATAATGDLLQVAVWSVDQHSKTRDDFTLRLTEAKARFKTKIPTETYTRTVYPNIEPSDEGKTIPTTYGKVYGVKPTVIDPSIRKFKVCSHSIHGFDAVRIKQDVDESFSVYFSDFLPYSTSVLRKYLPSVEVVRVKNISTYLTEVTALADVETGPNTFYYSDSFLYINIGTSALSCIVDYQRKASRWVTTSFSEVDLANGIFYLSVDWNDGQEVSVDYTGKDATIATDIVEDLLGTAGESSIDFGSFSSAADAFVVGLNSLNEPETVTRIGLHIDAPKELSELISVINSVAHTFTFTNEDGEFAMGSFIPKPVPDTYSITDQDVIDFSETSEPQDVASEFITGFAERKQDGFKQTYTHTRSEGFRLHNQADHVTVEKTVPLSEESDATLYTQRTSLMRSRPIRKVTITLHWKGWLFNLGEQISLNLTARGVSGKFEVIERTADVINSRIKITLGDLRGFGDSVGFWALDAPTLPTAFAALTGYGAGSAATWNASWHANIKAWARRNVGYWTDANGLANSTDPDSFIVSSWF